jgi:DNA modification methylase
MPDESVNCCVTSPPYWGLRDYGVGGQLGLESTPEEYVARMVDVFREVRRVLRDDGVCFLNLGDSYAGSANAGGETTRTCNSKPNARDKDLPTKRGDGIKPKDLIGIPWRVAFALLEDGWTLRQDIIWAKPNPMPESVRDRCTKAHEYIFLLSKSARYWWDAGAMKEPSVQPWRAGTVEKCFGPANPEGTLRQDTGRHGLRTVTRNRRSVWTISTRPYKGAHFATFPPKLVEPCILAGCPVGGIVLDPFAGSGTTLAVAIQHGRQAIGIELNPKYADECAVPRIMATEAR